jgi:hypothetical protein
MDKQRPHYYQWPYQLLPPPSDWSSWRRSLRRCVHDEQFVLYQQLGKWTDKNHEWTWFFSPHEEQNFQRTAEGWKLWIPNSRRALRTTNCPFKLVGLPTTYIAMVQQHEQLVRKTGYSMEKHTATPVIHSFHELAASQPTTRIWCIQHLTIDGDGSVLAQKCYAH